MQSNKSPFLAEYLAITPMALAFERAQECFLYNINAFSPKVLDFGCGDGVFSSILLESPVFVGVDLDYRELISAKHYQRHLSLTNSSGAALPFKNNCINTIFSNSVLEHIPDISSNLRELRRVLSKNGHFYLTVPSNKFDQASIIYIILRKLNFDKFAEKFRVQYNKFWKHYHYYSISKWQEVFELSGFKIKDLITYEPIKKATLNDFLVLFSLPSFLIKKIFNRFTLFPKIRKFFFWPLLHKPISDMKKIKHQEDGVLLFFTLIKR